MTSRRSRDMMRSFVSKGFLRSENDHHWFAYFHNGKKTSIRTKISHDSRDYGDELLSKVSRQLKLSKNQLLDLIDCPMSKDEYLKLLMDNGHILI